MEPKGAGEPLPILCTGSLYENRGKVWESLIKSAFLGLGIPYPNLSAQAQMIWQPIASCPAWVEIFPHFFLLFSGNGLLHHARGGEAEQKNVRCLVAAGCRVLKASRDLKSLVPKRRMPVQFRPPAPFFNSLCRISLLP